MDVFQYINASMGTLTVVVKASAAVDAYFYKNYLLYTRITVSDYLTPTGQPTSIPSGQPTGQPSSQPSSDPSGIPTARPTSKPTGRPSGQPSGQPTGQPSMQPTDQPTGQPSAQPTSNPTSSSPTFMPTLPPGTPFIWLGGSGFFNVSRNWNHMSVPGISSSTVVIALDRNSTVYIPTAYTFQNLNFSGEGAIQFTTSSASLNIINQFNFMGGYIQGFNSSTEAGVQLTSSNLMISTPARKYLQTITLLISSFVQWVEGDIIFRNATLHTTPSSLFSISNTSAFLKLISDASIDFFDAYPNDVLNNAFNFPYILPANAAVNDLLISNAVRVSTVIGSSGSELWPLEVSTDSSAGQYYANAVGAGSRATSVYNSTLSNVVDADTCALACLDSVNSCVSFDYYLDTQDCLLSSYSLSDIGGLVPPSRNGIVINDATHYEMKGTLNAPSSLFLVEGDLMVNGMGLILDVDLRLTGALYADRNTVISCNRDVNTISGSSLNLCGANLTLASGSGSVIGSIFDGCDNSSALIFSQSSYQLDASSLSLHIIALNDARVSTTGSFSMVAVNYLTISSNSSLTFSDSAVVSSAFLQIISGSSLLGQNITVNATAVTIDSSSSLRTSASEATIGAGLGAGIPHPTSASGGSYGGKGGGGAVSPGESYGSIFAPNMAGSTGGNSSFSIGGGAGGGVLSISSALISVDGAILSTGEPGSNGGGGGSGGSIFIVASNLLGNGTIAVDGGNGGYGGGLIVGGGGGGGRLAITANLFTFEGTLSAEGGSQPSTYDNTPMTAGPGTIFLIIGNGSITVSALIVTNTKVSNYGENVFQSTAPSSFSLINSSRTCNGAYLFDSLVTAMDVHILGSCPLIASTTSIFLSRVVPSGAAVFKIIGGTTVSISSSFVLSNFELDLFNASIASSSDLVVFNGSLVIHAGTTTPSLPYLALNSLQLSAGSTFIAEDFNLFMSVSSAIINNSMFLINGLLSVIGNSDLAFISSNISSIGSMGAILSLSNITNASISSTLNLQNCDLTMGGVTFLSGSIVSSTNSLVRSLLGSALMIVSSFSYISAIDAPSFMDGTIVIANNTTLTISANGTYSSSCILDTSLTGTLIFVSGYSNLSGNLLGNGVIQVQSYLNPPLALNSTPSISIGLNGVVACYDTSVYDFSFLTLSGGQLLVASATFISTLVMEAPGSTLVMANNSTLTVNTSLFVADSTLSGVGSIIISSSAKLVFNSATNVTVLEVFLLNYGSAVFQSGLVLFSRASVLSNYGQLILSGASLNYIEGIFAYNSYLSVTTSDYIGASTLVNTSLYTCAYICSGYSINMPSPSPVQETINSMLPCQSFQYNARLQLCTLDARSPESMSPSLDAPGFASDLYISNPAWKPWPLIMNMAEGVVNITTESLISVPLENFGAIYLPASSGLYSSRAFSNYAEGTMNGSGILQLSLLNHTFYGDYSSPSLSVNITGTNIAFTAILTCNTYIHYECLHRDGHFCAYNVFVYCQHAHHRRRQFDCFFSPNFKRVYSGDNERRDALVKLCIHPYHVRSNY